MLRLLLNRVEQMVLRMRFVVIDCVTYPPMHTHTHGRKLRVPHQHTHTALANQKPNQKCPLPRFTANKKIFVGLKFGLNELFLNRQFAGCGQLFLFASPFVTGWVNGRLLNNQHLFIKVRFAFKMNLIFVDR